MTTPIVLASPTRRSCCRRNLKEAVRVRLVPGIGPGQMKWAEIRIAVIGAAWSHRDQAAPQPSSSHSAIRSPRPPDWLIAVLGAVGDEDEGAFPRAGVGIKRD